MARTANNTRNPVTDVAAVAEPVRDEISAVAPSAAVPPTTGRTSPLQPAIRSTRSP
ncbi:MAG: hypothetical protein QM779_15760 [Propionicimonas sp.]|uniref:hypothetical protein n=1 Tax=Propionicimonas sp. TaxID=1955623 RepID=UPI003D0D2D46